MTLSAAQLMAIQDRFDVAMDGAEAPVIAKIQDALETAYLQMEPELVRAYNATSGNLSLLPKQRELLITNEITQYLDRLDGDTTSLYSADFQQLLQANYAGGRDMAEELLSAIANPRLESFAAVPLGAVRFAAQNAAGRLKKHTRAMRDGISSRIAAGLALGQSGRAIADTLRADLGLTKTRAEMVVRTESLAAHNESAAHTYRRNGVEQFVFLATQDERTCPFCGARNGTIYNLGESEPPVHPRCRCTLIPYREGWDRAGLYPTQFISDFREEGLQILARQGTAPNYGRSPFERMNNLPAPTPVGIVGAGIQSAAQLGDAGIVVATVAKGRAYLESLLSEEDVQTLDRVAPQLADLDRRYQELAARADAVDASNRVGREMLALEEEVSNLLAPIDESMGRLRSGLIGNARNRAAGLRAAKRHTLSEAAANLYGESDPVDFLGEFHALTRNVVQGSIKTLDYAGQRAGTNEFGYLNLGLQQTPRDLKRVIFHEAGHHLEFISQENKNIAQQWIKSRASGGKRKLNDIMGTTRYGDDETAYPDDFINPYVGKVYEGDGYNGETEVISVGLEHFSRPESMVKLYSRDREHFELIMGIIAR